MGWSGVIMKAVDSEEVPVDVIGGGEALDAVRHIRAISWRWRWTEVVHAPRLILDLGRRRYGVAAQDVESELGDRVPGIVLRTRNGLLKVRYGLLAEVVARAAERAGLPLPAEVPADRERPRWGYEQLAPTQLHCQARSETNNDETSHDDAETNAN